MLEDASRGETGPNSPDRFVSPSCTVGMGVGRRGRGRVCTFPSHVVHGAIRRAVRVVPVAVPLGEAGWCHDAESLTPACLMYLSTCICILASMYLCAYRYTCVYKYAYVYI